MSRLDIHLVGPFRVSLDGQPVTGLESDKVRALLAYLAVEADQPHLREKLVGLLWPDQAEQAARANLRRALSNLRKVVEDDPAIADVQASPPYLRITRQTVQFNSGSGAWHFLGRDKVGKFGAEKTSCLTGRGDVTIDQNLSKYRGTLQGPGQG